jgi:ABC-type multidrug transport system ATPase subunit
VKKIDEFKWQLTFNKADDIRQAIMKLAVEKNITILSMKIEEQSLEDIFQKLTN